MSSLQTDNYTTAGVTNNTIIPKLTKAMDMCFHWIHCRYYQSQFCYYWAPGISNIYDYSTKHHPPLQHKEYTPKHVGRTT